MAKTSCKGDDIVFGFNELSTPVKAIISLAFVLLLVVIAGLILRRISGGRLKFPGQGARARQPRLGIVDVFEMDRQRQLVLLRRDNVEHLVMIGGPNDLVIEASIVRSARAQVPIAAETAELPLSPEPRQPIVAVALPDSAAAPAAPLPRPAQTASLRPSSPELATLPAGAAMAAAGAVVAGQSLASPPPAPRPNPAAAPPASPVTTQASSPVMSPAASPLLEPIAAPASARASQTELDDMTRQLQEALARPFSGVKPVAAPPAAPVAAPALPAKDINAQDVTAQDITAKNDKPAGEIVAVKDTAPASDPAPSRDRAASAKAEATPVLPDAMASAMPLNSELERELQAVLSASLLPEAEPAGKAIAPADIKVDAKPASKADAPKPEAASPAPESAPAKPAAPARDDAASRPEMPKGDTSLADKAPVKPKEPDPAAPDLTPSGKAVEGGQPPAPAPASAASSEPGPDPFSVDAIEAEFARLLNRSTPPKT
ncbi:MAG: hypothetical protein MUC44_02355 [Beijerinckiaceae bacterium]|jgi:hypothetical protein|nr:hypothetical protein [Beijerinckiaceae bacterium]